MALQHLDTGDNSNIDLADIQGDILVGLQKDAEVFIFFSIGHDIKTFKRKLTALRPLVTSTKTVLERERQIDDARKAGNRQRLPLFGLNLGFTYRGLAKLLGDAAFDKTHPVDPSFKADAAARATFLKDDTGKWRTPFTNKSIDGCLLVTGPKLAGTRAHADAILDELGDTIVVVYDEHGQTRPQRGHEHFGFLDGVSQPGIRGLTKRQNPLDKEQGLPGQDLIHPGEFVFGYPGQMDPKAGSGITKETIGDIVAPPLRWMQNGSYMVFRRLEQKVLLFRDFVEKEADNLGMDTGMMAARMVGRWPSGAPLMLSPLQDNPALGADTMANNDFEFDADRFQRRCPYAAHIRKTYPRDDLNDAGPPDLADEGGETSVQTRRLRRAGIPFGPEISDEDDKIGKEQSRGLMFVCYQTSILNQFEFVQSSWANAPGFVFGKTRPGPGGGPVTPGEDPIIGQTGNPRHMDEPIPNYPTGNARSSLTIPDQFVESTGAAYFFMPSLSALLSSPLVE